MTEFNIRASRYCVLEARHVCQACKQTTRVFALAVPPGHEDIEGGSTVALNDDSPGLRGEDFRDWLFAPDQWYLVDGWAMISSVAALSDSVAQHLQSRAPSYLPDTASDACWANHCEHCSAAIFDGHLYARAGDPFAPKDAGAAAGIQVHPVDAPFEAYYRMCWSEEYADKQALFARIAAADHPTKHPDA